MVGLGQFHKEKLIMYIGGGVVTIVIVVLLVLFVLRR
jgi:flagellar biosynthesis/type III secretory pathway M-ring protein FliF/YscJ